MPDRLRAQSSISLLLLWVCLSVLSGPLLGSIESPTHLVLADKPSLFNRIRAPDPPSAPAPPNPDLAAQSALQGLRALSKEPVSDSSPKKKKRVSKGKDLDNLLNAAQASSKDQPQQESRAPIKKKKKKKKVASHHEDDIIHDFDHANNDAYDDVIWYDGPHRDDEEESHHDYDDIHYDDHHEDHHDDHDEDHGDDHDDDHDDQPLISSVKVAPEHIVNLSQQSTIQQPPPSDDTQHAHPFNGRYQHSGAEPLLGPVSAREFCLRLKHECESTCREFRSTVSFLSTTCEAGSVAELLFWGRCCQLGQDHRLHSSLVKTTIKPEDLQQDLDEKHLLWQQKRHQAQRDIEKEGLA